MISPCKHGAIKHIWVFYRKAGCIIVNLEPLFLGRLSKFSGGAAPSLHWYLLHLHVNSGCPTCCQRCLIQRTVLRLHKIVLHLQECKAVLKQHLCYLNGSHYNPQQKVPDSMYTGDDCLDLGSHLTCSPLCDRYVLHFDWVPAEHASHRNICAGWGRSLRVGYYGWQSCFYLEGKKIKDSFVI